MPPPSTPPPNKQRKRSGPIMPGGWIWLVILLMLVGMFLLTNFGNNGIEYSEFLKLVEEDNLTKVVFVGTERIVGEVKDTSRLPAEVQKKLGSSKKFLTLRPPVEDRKLMEDLRQLAAKKGPDPKDPNKTIEPLKIVREEDNYGWVGPLLMMLLPAVLLLALFFFLLPRFRDPMGGGFLSNYIKSPARRYDRTKMRVTFNDVADMQSAKGELQEIVEFLRSPEKFQRLGAVVPKGVLLVGPPGTGKTLLARAVAGEAGVPFFNINGSEFIQMFVGVGASVTGDTPVLIRRDGRTRLVPIGELVDDYYRNDEEGFVIPVQGVEALGFEERDSKFKGSSKVFVKGSAWSRVRGVFRHRVKEIYEIHYLGGVVRTTADHSVFIRTRDGIKAVAACNLKPGDVLVSLPLKVRGQYLPGQGTTHSVRAHTFETLESPRFLKIVERDEATVEKHAFVLAGQGIMTQQEIADVTGVSQTTVSNWQRGRYSPRAISSNYTDTVLPEAVEVTPELLKLFGYYTAEGRENGNLEFTFGNHEKDLHADCMVLGEKLFGVTPKVEQTEDNATRIKFYSAPLGRFFARHCGKGSHHKHLPEILWDLPREYFLAFLEGYTRGDGYVSGESKLIATSVSQQLIRELAWLCAMHGIKTGIRHWHQQGGRVIKKSPLPAGEAWNLIIGKTSNPLASETGSNQGKKAIIREIVVKPFDGYVYDLCGCDNEAFFGGEKPILLHNSRVRDLFKTAKDNAPSILFIDEIDAVGRMRGAGVGGGSDEREQTLNQILSEMDGFQPTESVIVVAATNRPDVLDSALLRPGRFDRHITIDRPTWQGRMEILKVHTRNKPLADDVNLEQVARTMIGMTGADLRNLANEAALLATREGKAKIDRSDFTRAADRVLLGPKRDEVMTPDSKRRTAYHEAGHAIVAWYEPEGDKPMKVTILARGQTLGVNLSVGDEDRFHHGVDYFRARLAVLMGGRAADRLVFGQSYTGAEGDIKQATRWARYMVTHWGMSERLGPMYFRVGEEHVFLGKEIQEARDFSEGTAQVIDEEVQKLLREADERATSLLQTHRDKLDRLVEALLQREELHREEIDEVLNSEGPLPPTIIDGQAPKELVEEKKS